jgi:kinetochore protein Mis18
MFQPKPQHGALQMQPSPMARVNPSQVPLQSFPHTFQYSQTPVQNQDVQFNQSHNVTTSPQIQTGSAFTSFKEQNVPSQPVQFGHQSQPQPVQQMEQQAPEIKNYLIFQCEGCREIIGDSLSFVIANQEFDYIVLQGVTDSVVQVPADMGLYNPQDIDKGSIFFKLSCKRCSRYIGKRYSVTSGVPSEYKDRFCLFRDKLQSYEIGTVTTAATDAQLQNLPTCQTLQTENTMIQRILLVQKDLLEQQQKRIEQLEQRNNEILSKMDEQSESIKTLKQGQRRIELVQTVIKTEADEDAESRKTGPSNKRKKI